MRPWMVARVSDTGDARVRISLTRATGSRRRVNPILATASPNDPTLEMM